MDAGLTDLTAFLQKYPIRKFKKGQTVLFQGEVPRYAYVTKSGIIKTYNISPLGEEQIISLSIEYEVIPEAWFLQEASVAYYFYEAFTDCEVYTVPRGELAAEVENHPGLSNTLLRRFMQLYIGARVHVNALEQSRSRDKLIHLLHYLMMRFSTSPPTSDIAELDIRLTHQTLANMLGVTRETIAMEVSRLRKEKIVDYKQQTYSIYRKKLLALRNEDDLISGF